MNFSLFIAVSSILIIALFLFWLFYRNSNSTHLLSKKYILNNLASNDLNQQQRSELEQQLSHLLQKDHPTKSTKLLILIAVITVPASVLLYFKMGNPKAINYEISTNQSQSNVQNPGNNLSMEEAIKQLEQKLANNPDDIDGQMLFARSQVSLKDYDKAVKAYRKANELAPNEPVILTELAEAVALLNNNSSFLGEPEELLKKAVSLDDTNQKALWLYGMTFYEKNELEKTNELWSKLYDLMTDDKAKAQLLEQLSGVRTKLGIESNQTIENNSESLIQLNIQIAYDDKALPPQSVKRGILYVYAKAASGMPMPIAAVQKPLEVLANSFPIQITMSDSNNLQVNRKLSDFDTVSIGARISFSGNATPQAGDFQSSEVTIDLTKTNSIDLVIDQVKQ